MVKINGSKLQEIRKSRNMTQEYLAEHGDTTERYIRDLERGRKHNPSALLLYRVARTLGITMEELLENQEEEI